MYLFNPFAAPVVLRIIKRIEAEFANRPGMLDLIYFNPEAEQLLQGHPGFELLWTGTMAMSEEDQAADPVASPDDRLQRLSLDRPAANLTAPLNRPIRRNPLVTLGSSNCFSNTYGGSPARPGFK